MKKEGVALGAAALATGIMGADQQSSHAEDISQTPPAITSNVELPQQQYPDLKGFKITGVGEETKQENTPVISAEELSPQTTNSTAESHSTEMTQNTEYGQDSQALSQEIIEENSAEEQKAEGIVFIEGDKIFDKEAYKQLVIKNIANKDELLVELAKLQGDNAQSVEFDAENQVAFLLALDSDQPLFEFKGVQDEPGKTNINFSFSTKETDGEQYDPEKRSNYYIGIMDKGEEYKKMQVNISFLHNGDTPFITSTIGEFNKPTYTVPVGGVTTAELDKCFGESMTEISALMKEYDAAAVEFYPASNGAGYYYIFY